MGIIWDPDIIRLLGEHIRAFASLYMPGTAGRFMTISKGAVLKGIDLGTIKKELSQKGFQIKGEE